MTRTARLRSALSSLLIAATALSVPALHTSSAQAQDKSLRIAAVVNDDIVSVMDLTMRLRMALHSSRLPNIPENNQKLAPQVLRSLIDERLQEQQAKALNVSLSDQELQDAIQRIEQSNNMRPGQLQLLARQLRLPYDIFKDQIRIGALWAKAVNRKYARQAKVSDEDVQDRLNQMKENLGRPEHQVSEIYLPFDASDNPQQVLAFSAQLAEQLRTGAPFAATARQFSRSPTAMRGGNLGWVPQGQLEPELDRALASMKQGDISKPIQTISGLYILKLNARRTLNTPDPKETRLRLSQIKLPVVGKKALSVTDRAKVLEYISNSLRGCSTFDTYGKTLGTPGSGPLGSLKAGELPESIASTISSLNVGEPSAAVELGGVTTVLMVCEKTTPSVLPSKDALKATMSSERLTRNAERLLRDLRRSAIIDVRI